MDFFAEPKAGEEIAVVETTLGVITLAFFRECAPKAVENFITHSKNGYYDGVIFHRVINGFMIQSGDPKGTGRGGQSIWGSPFKNENDKDARNYRGALAMANAGPDTNGSQFYIVQAGTENIDDSALAQSRNMTPEAASKYKEVGGAPWLDGGYTVFGRVISGMDVVDKIASAEVDFADKPLKTISVTKITVKQV